VEKTRLDRLNEELKKYERKVSQLQKDWTVTKAGSRYGDEYLETQIKVYQTMIRDTKAAIFEEKKELRSFS
jgi:flagellar motility protein MotE (MotC chaperone)